MAVRGARRRLATVLQHGNAMCFLARGPIHGFGGALDADLRDFGIADGEDSDFGEASAAAASSVGVGGEAFPVGEPLMDGAPSGGGADAARAEQQAAVEEASADAARASGGAEAGALRPSGGDGVAVRPGAGRSPVRPLTSRVGGVVGRREVAVVPGAAPLLPALGPGELPELRSLDRPARPRPEPIPRPPGGRRPPYSARRGARHRGSGGARS